MKRCFFAGWINLCRNCHHQSGSTRTLRNDWFLDQVWHQHEIEFQVWTFRVVQAFGDRVVEQVEAGFSGLELALRVGKVQSKHARTEQFVTGELEDQVEPFDKIGIGKFSFPRKNLD